VVQPAYGVPPDDEEAIRREAARIRARQQLEQLAQKIGGPGTRVADPAKFTQFLATADQQHRAQGGQGLEPPADFADIVASRAPARFQAIQEERARRGIPTGPTPAISSEAQGIAARRQEIAGPDSTTLPPDERGRMLEAIAMLAPVPFSPARTAGSIIAAEAAPRIVKALGGGPTAQTVAGIGGGVLGGAPEIATKGVPALARGGARLATKGVDEAALRLQGRQVAHAATQQTIPPTAAAPVTAQPARQVFDPFGLGENKLGLTRLDRIQNVIREQSQKAGVGVTSDAEITPAMRNRARILQVGESQKDIVAHEVETQIKRAGFQFDDKGRIPALANIDIENPSGPTLSSLAARLPLYAQTKLTPRQFDAMEKIRTVMEPYSASLQRVGIEYGQRPDIIPGGFYFPRTADLKDDVQAMVFSGRGVRRGMYNKPTRFNQAEQGLAAGVDYLAPEDAARGFVQGVAKDVADAETANYIKSLGKGSSPADRIDLALKFKVEQLRSRISGRIHTLAAQTARAGEQARTERDLGKLTMGTEKTLGELAALPIDQSVAELGKSLGLTRAQVQRREIKEALYEWARSFRNEVGGKTDPLYSGTASGAALERARGELRVLERLDTKFGKSLGATRAKVDRITTRVQGQVERAGERVSDRYATTAGRLTNTSESLDDLRGQLASLNGEWDRAKRISQQTPREMGTTDLPGLEGYALPVKLADAVQTVLNESKSPTGALERVLGPTRTLMQAGMTTLDNSWTFLQGLPGLADDPKAFAFAMKANFKAWAKPDVIRAAIEDSDRVAVRKGLPSATVLARYGLDLSEGGIAVADVKIPARIKRVPGISNAQRAFETSGIVYRLKHTYDVLEEEIAHGRTLQDIIDTGDIEKITRSSKRITGVAESPAGGGIGQHVLFAARFLQARMANVANGIMGLRSIELSDVVPLLPEKLNVRVGFKTPLEQRYARRAMLRMIGAGVGLTVAANEARGYDTDFRPVVNGRWNSNFIKVRNVSGRDVSLFGSYDSLLRLIVGSGAGVATGRPGETISAWRGMGAPHIALAWDLISGEDAVGNPVPKITELRGEDFPELGERVAESFTPISLGNAPQGAIQSVQNVQDDKPLQAAGDVGITAFEFHGGKTAPTGFIDEADRVSKSIYGKQWYDLTEDQQKSVRTRLYRESPEVMLRSAEQDFAEYNLRRLNAQGIGMLRSSLNKLKASGNPRVSAKAREMLADLDKSEKSRRGAQPQMLR